MFKTCPQITANGILCYFLIRIKSTPPRAQGLLTEVWQRRKRQK